MGTRKCRHVLVALAFLGSERALIDRLKIKKKYHSRNLHTDTPTCFFAPPSPRARVSPYRTEVPRKCVLLISYQIGFGTLGT